MESASSWGPQANSQPEPPMAHAPKPTGVILMSEFPSLRVCIRILSTGGATARFACAIILILPHWHWMNRVRKKLEESRKIKGNSSVHCDCSIERNGFAIRIRDGELLGTCSKAWSDDGERVHVLEGYGGGLPVDGDGGGALKAAAANG